MSTFRYRFGPDRLGILGQHRQSTRNGWSTAAASSPSWAWPRAWRSLLVRLVPEVVLVAAGFIVYNLGRIVAAGHTGRAFEHAQQIWNLEGYLRFPSEQVLQAWALKSADLVKAANAYYANVHFPLTIAVLVWLFYKHSTIYRWARNAIFASTAVALSIHFLYPLAPPRMLSGLGFIDTGIVDGQSVYGPPGTNSTANQFAAMPSLHVGWAVLIAIVMIVATTSRWRWLWVAHPIITIFVVTVTANHYWLDGIAGTLLVCAALAIFKTTRASTDRSEDSFDGPLPGADSALRFQHVE